MTYDRAAFTTYSEIAARNLDLGASSTAQIIGQGDVTLQLRVKGKLKKCVIKNVKHVSSLRYQLLSVSCMAKLGIKTTFDGSKATLQRSSDRHLLATGTITSGGLYTLDAEPSKRPSDTALVASLSLWHRHLAHVNQYGITGMANHGVVDGVRISHANSPTCTGCILGKGHRSPIPKSSPSRASRVLELVHSDVMGPLEVSSVSGSRYLITFIDDYSNWTAEYYMCKKSEALDCLMRYKSSAERHTNQILAKLHVHEYRNGTNCEGDEIKLKILRSGNGGEYLSNKFKQYLQGNGIKHELTVAYTPQQNGLAERMKRTLLDLVRSMLHHMNIEKRFWAEALATAVYIRNRVTSRSRPAKTTPHHLWHGEPPNLSHARVFGAQCWCVIPKSKVKKLDARAREGVMMGYSSQSKGY